MKVTKEKTIHQITFFPALFPVNCFLVEEEDSLTLVDTALASSAEDIIRVIKELGKPLHNILLTHAHGDHVGSLDALKAEFPGVSVAISKRDARLLAGDRTMDAGEPSSPIRGSLPKGLKTKADVLLNDGDRIGSLSAISVPGHTPGSMAFLDQRNHILIAGDAFQIRGGLAVSGQLRWSFPFPAMATWNKAAALDSARKLRQYQPSVLAAGHGSFLKNPAAAMDQAIGAAKKI
ncbi:MBL fold metallo-hydrolase [Fictibacillus fluitans]|uniref:MBL fold metallo-hydrolase n=1 Tax=Fictibacillus fluitans TaxID=3058422 RepID=A0ABT8HTF7_9BACL|nr:MBL fold metallo-hydrolase [Fictibacillus sp. NE201]MDN4524054.1 MBL fold metallo-hydrolase [Fictibacillus sp. NE201]